MVTPRGISMEIVVRRENGNMYEWVDLCKPSAQELMSVMDSYKIHKTAILDCLDPHHLPKLERFKDGVFLIVRMHELSANLQEVNLQKITRKISIYWNGSTLLTIRRDGESPIDELLSRWRSKGERGSLDTVAHPLNEIMDAVLESYTSPLDDCQQRLDSLEKLSFQDSNFNITQAQDAYSLIAKCSVIKRMLVLFLHIIERIDYIPESSRPYYNDLKEEGEGLLFWVQDIQENTGRILQLQLSLEAQKTNEASQKTNEIMRSLTIFSLLFMPLNFIAGIYGMNFSRMPLIDHPLGFWLSLAMMGASILSIIFWMSRQGWISSVSVKTFLPDQRQMLKRVEAITDPIRKE